MFGISLYQEKHLSSSRQPFNPRSPTHHNQRPQIHTSHYARIHRMIAYLSQIQTLEGVSWRPGLQSRFLFVLQEGGPGPGLAQRETTPVLSPYTSTVDYSPNALSNFNIPPHYQ